MNQVLKIWPQVYRLLLLRLELDGKIKGLQVGQKVYYPYDQLVELFGEPLVKLPYQPAAA